MLDLVTKIEQIARLANLQWVRDGDLLVFAFDMEEGRRQTVAVTHYGKTDDGANMVLFFSPCQRISRGLLSGGLSRDHAIDLLRHTAKLSFGHFAIMDFDGTEMVCVRATQIYETLGVPEFKAYCHAVAVVADEWEVHRGQDEF